MTVRFLKITFLGLMLGSVTLTLCAQSSDQSFVRQAASGGMAEVKMGQLAQDKGASDGVKNFGKMMEMDHTNAGNQLKEVAGRNKITVPDKVNARDQATYDKFSKLSGSDFDKAYADQMIMDHQKTIALFKKEMNDGQNPDLKGLATETLPTLQEHLKQAREMKEDAGKEH
jgi:putative membrane protein